MSSLVVSNLTAGYERRPAIHHISATFEDGSLTAIAGPNGGGKSTFLKALVGLLPSMSGEMVFSGQHAACCKTAYLPQMSEIDRSFPMSVTDVVLMGCWRQSGFFSRLTTRQRKRAAQALEQVGMSAFAHRPIAALSVGQFQRVLFARLMVEDAACYLLDEPFSAIDSRTTKDLLAIIRGWQEAGKTVLCVLHDMRQVQDYFPQAMLLAREVIAFGKTTDVLTEAHMRKAASMANIWHDHADECHVDEGQDAS